MSPRSHYGRAYFLGVSAFRSSKPLSDNPYLSRNDSASFAFWRSGWTNAQRFFNSYKPMLTFSNPNHSPPDSDLTYGELDVLGRLEPIWDYLKKSLGRDLDFLLDYLTDVFIMSDDVDDYSGLAFFTYRGIPFEYGLLTHPIYLRQPDDDVEFSSFDELRFFADSQFPAVHSNPNLIF